MADPQADADGFLRDMEGYAALGVDTVTLSPPTDDPVGWTTDVVEKVLPRLSAL